MNMMIKNLIMLIAGILLFTLTGTSRDNHTIKLPEPEKSGGMPLMEAFQNRRSSRSFSDKPLPLQEISNLLWAAYGINRTDGKRTVPSALGWNEFDIYVVKADGWFQYNPDQHILVQLGTEDLRKFTGTQDFVETAPLNLVYVADFDRMEGATEEEKIFYSAADAGFIGQNVYLYAASAGLSTVVRGGIDREKARTAFHLKPSQQIILAQTAGYPGN